MFFGFSLFLVPLSGGPSRQGTSIGGTITIHKRQKSYLVSREWLWCSITRAKDFDNVYFFKNENADEEMQTNFVIYRIF